jgi:signal transduction histidine kinase
MRLSRPTALSIRLALASLGTVLAVGTVCAVGLVSLGDLSHAGRLAVTQHLELLDDAAAFNSLLYQKGFVAEYLLTRDPNWLTRLEVSRPVFETWLSDAEATASGDEERRLIDGVRAAYVAYSTGRKAAIDLFDKGDHEDAKELLAKNHVHLDDLLSLFTEFGRLGRRELESQLHRSEVSVRRLALLLVGTSIAGALASLLVGFWWARRITKPIYELQVQVESAAERTRIQVKPGRDGLDSLGDQVGAMVERLEQADAALIEHRRRLIQSEKLSAVGEIAASLAHEVLNPLAGMKAAVQLLARPRSGASPEEVVQTAEALNREISRVEALVRRLVNYARPLAPRIRLSFVSSLLDDASEAMSSLLSRNGVQLRRTEEDELPPLEVDPLLITQVLCNLMTNAAQATAAGGTIEVRARRAASLGKDQISITVSDNGPGIAESVLPKLFHPFFTTKPDGHGLGLAVSQNIALEHGGRITARNRPAAEGGGAVFELSLPIVR